MRPETSPAASPELSPPPPHLVGIGPGKKVSHDLGNQNQTLFDANLSEKRYVLLVESNNPKD
jgi:hypothetical protein